MKKLSRMIIVAVIIALCLSIFCFNTYAVRQVYNGTDGGSSDFNYPTPANLPLGAMEALTGGGYIISANPGYGYLPPLSGNRTTYGTDYFTVGGKQVYDPGALASSGSNQQSGYGVRETNPLDAVYGRGLHSIND